MLHRLRVLGVTFATRTLLPVVLGNLRKVTPTGRHVVVCGVPPIEGNVVELVRSLSSRYPGTIVWLRHPSARYIADLGIDTSRIRLLDRYSLRALWLYVTAAATFFTHGLYGEPAALPRKPTINVWHGAGPKMLGNGLFGLRRLSSPPCDYFVSASRLWGEYLVRECGISPDRLLLTGHPRNDPMFREEEHGRAASRSGAFAEPFVLWMPAYRTIRAGRSMREHRDVATAPVEDPLLAPMIERIERAGYRVMVKPHPLDSADYSRMGLEVLDDGLLQEHGLQLSHVLRASSGLITDYSSVCTDYVPLGKPIGFHLHDLEAYSSGRGLIPGDFPDWVPGTRLDTGSGIDRFIADLEAGGALTASRREHFGQRVGLVNTTSAADDLLDALAAHGHSRFARMIAPREAH